jgi:tetratricopeptide (TPR) repeat protein
MLSIHQVLPTMRIFLVVFSSFLICLILSCDQGKNPQDNTPMDPSKTEGEVSLPDPTLDSINLLIANSPSNYAYYLARAKHFASKLNFKEAYLDVARAHAIDSTQSEIYLVKGELHFAQQQFDSAYVEYSNCIHFDPNNESCLLNKAAIDIALQNYELARKLINDAVVQNEFNSYAYYLRGRLYRMTGDTALSFSSYKTAIEVDPNYYEAYIEVGLLYAEQKSDLAKEYYNSAIVIKPTSVEAWYNKAMFLQETGFKKKERYREAFACYDTILKIDNRFFASYFNKGFIWLEYLQQYDSAAVCFTKAIEQYPDYFQAYYNRGLCNESMNKRKDAESDYREALRISPQYDDAAKALDRLMR